MPKNVLFLIHSREKNLGKSYRNGCQPISYFFLQRRMQFRLKTCINFQLFENK